MKKKVRRERVKQEKEEIKNVISKKQNTKNPKNTINKKTTKKKKEEK